MRGSVGGRLPSLLQAGVLDVSMEVRYLSIVLWVCIVGLSGFFIGLGGGVGRGERAAGDKTCPVSFKRRYVLIVCAHRPKGAELGPRAVSGMVWRRWTAIPTPHPPPRPAQYVPTRLGSG